MNWLTSILHQIDAALYVLTAEAIDTSLAYDPEVDCLGPSASEDAGIDYVLYLRTIYIMVPFMVILLDRYLMPVEVWSCIQGDIVNAGADADFQPIINWILVAFTQKSGDNHIHPLPMP